VVNVAVRGGVSHGLRKGMRAAVWNDVEEGVTATLYNVLADLTCV